jgi:hypothetical protein
MSEENKTLLRRYVDEVWHKRNLGVLEELMSADFVDHALIRSCATPRVSGGSTRHTKRPSSTPPM